MINRQTDMEIVAVAANGEEAITLFRHHRPDVTLMDLQLPKVSGLEAIRAIRAEAPHARIIVLTMYQGDEDIFRALQAGAVTYLFKDMLASDLVRIVRDVHDGKRPLPSTIEKFLAQRETESGLTPREVEIVELIANGMRNKEIAAKLGISDETVKVHVRNVLAKLHVNDRSAAISIAMRRGIIHINR